MSYQIHIKPSNHSFQAEAHEPILEAALRQGIAFPYGCRSGVCGTCLGNVIAGDIHYPDGLPMGLSEHDHKTGKALFCQAVARSDLTIEVAEIEAASGIKAKTLPVKIASLRKLAPDVMEMLLKLPETERLQFLAGQYIDILLPMGKKRAFSLANAPANDAYLELHIRHVEGGSFTSRVFNELQENSLLRIDGPHGSFFLRDSERPKILMGGGTGFAPLKAMLEQIIQEQQTQPVYLYWGARAKIDLYHRELAEKWAFQYDHIHFIPVLSAPQPDDHWQGETGLVHEIVARDFPDLSGFDIYMSGPPAMIKAATPCFRAAGASDAHLFSDAFEYSEDTLSAMK